MGANFILSTPFPIKIKNFLCVACHKRAYFTLADIHINDTIILVENQGVSRKPCDRTVILSPYKRSEIMSPLWEETFS
jgi:hypothetical protein